MTGPAGIPDSERSIPGPGSPAARAAGRLLAVRWRPALRTRAFRPERRPRRRAPRETVAV